MTNSALLVPRDPIPSYLLDEITEAIAYHDLFKKIHECTIEDGEETCPFFRGWFSSSVHRGTVIEMDRDAFMRLAPMARPTSAKDARKKIREARREV